MTHPLNEWFDKVYCINLAERPDKREIMERKFDKLGIEVEWFTAVKYDFAPRIVPALVEKNVSHFNVQHPYEIGAALSHYTVLKKALLEGHDQVFVFEDDVLFDKKFNEKVGKYLETAPEDANMLMFYSFMYEMLPQHQRMNSRWMRSYRAWSLMAYGMDSHMIKEYIKRQDAFFTMSDMVTYKMQDEGFNVYSTIPSICLPDSTIRSNIRGDNKNYQNTPTITNLGVSDDNYE